MFQWGIFNSQSKFKFYSSCLYWIKILEKLWAKLRTAIHCTYIKLYVRNYNDICLEVYSLIKQYVYELYICWPINNTIQYKDFPRSNAGPFTWHTFISGSRKKEKRNQSNKICPCGSDAFLFICCCLGFFCF